MGFDTNASRILCCRRSNSTQPQRPQQDGASMASLRCSVTSVHPQALQVDFSIGLFGFIGMIFLKLNRRIYSFLSS
jgi:hypothetical protein